MANGSPDVEPSGCTKKSRLNLWLFVASVGKKGGAAAYEKTAAIQNQVVDAAVAIIQSYITIFEPLLLIDNFILDKFIRPPLELALSAVEGVTKGARAMSEMGATGGCPDQTDSEKAQNKRASRSMKFIRGVADFDVSEGRETLESLSRWAAEDDDLLKGLKETVEVLDFFKLPSTWEGFKALFKSETGQDP